jgi:hypothetical protein
MAGFDADKIDLVATDAGGVRLFIVADRAWATDGSDIPSLSEKIHNYVAFALDGQMVALYPEVAGWRWAIVIDAQVSEPPNPTRLHLEQIGAAVKRHGGELRLLLPDEASGQREESLG